MIDVINWFFAHLDPITVGATILVFIFHKVYSLCKNSPNSLDNALLKCLSAAGLPNGLAFLICALMPEYIAKMQGASLPYALAGLALLTVSMKDVFKVGPPQPGPATEQSLSL